MIRFIYEMNGMDPHAKYIFSIDAQTSRVEYILPI